MRPREGRYLGGVCGALARATNTDPVLWRVLLAVLGVISGVGVLLYLIGWLVIPAEGEPASPIESLLGKGRSGMAPASVVLLGGAAVLSFAFIVRDGMRASLLACAVIVGAVLIIKRGGNQQAGGAAFPGPAQPAPGPFAPGADDRTAEFAAAPPAPPTQPMTTQPMTTQPVTDPVAAPPPPPPPPPYTPPATGYRPPFAPHGPYARPTPVTYPPAPPAPAAAKPVKPPKPPRERSKLGRLTFFAVVVVVGVMAAIDMAGASIAISAYFAAALITVGLGLIVGAWLGRARGLIALGLLISIGLLVSTGAERWAGEVGNSVYRPATLAQVADRYDFTAGNATLDLRQVTFTGEQSIAVTMKLGQIRVLLPETVDTTATLRVENGRAVVFDKQFDDREVNGQTVTDLGLDGAGGGTLKLDLQLDTGNVEVLR
ncbi:PspC domain-containing protein [Actinoplanes sp. URMC 104]|uniref:PspC domain-containing protein n=1 Tax=Actinoplanes sp. URMC 104 TaxID=3423409 RepID=UPI003F1A82B1